MEATSSLAGDVTGETMTSFLAGDVNGEMMTSFLAGDVNGDTMTSFLAGDVNGEMITSFLAGDVTEQTSENSLLSAMSLFNNGSEVDCDPTATTSGVSSYEILNNVSRSLFSSAIHDNEKEDLNCHQEPSSSSSLCEREGNVSSILDDFDWSPSDHLNASADQNSKEYGDAEVSSTVDLSAYEKKSVKRKRNRQKQPNWTPPVPILPPCRICDEKSSGYHYGANTCEACKGFFRRTLKKKSVDFRCKCTKDEGETWKQGPVKNGCPSCRYERCLASGMSKNAIKIGRYTVDHKTENIKEVKSLESIDTLIQDAITHAQEEVESGLTNPFPNLFDITSESPDQKNERLMPSTADSPGATFGVPLKEIDFIVKRCLDAHIAYVEACPASRRESQKQEHVAYLRQFLLKQQTFGELQSLSREEYFDFFNSTGIDVDGRQQFLKQALKFIKVRCEHLVKFARSIPGISDLHLDDQARLVKASRVDNFLTGSLSNLRFASPELQVFTAPWGETLHVKEVEHIIPRHLVIERYKVRSRLHQLDLTDTELALLRAVLVTMPDRAELVEPENVEILHQKLLACLQHMLHVRPGGPRNLIYKLVNIMVQLRSMYEREHEWATQLLSDWPFLSEIALLREMIS